MKTKASSRNSFPCHSRKRTLVRAAFLLLLLTLTARASGEVTNSTELQLRAAVRNSDPVTVAANPAETIKPDIASPSSTDPMCTTNGAPNLISNRNDTPSLQLDKLLSTPGSTNLSFGASVVTNVEALPTISQSPADSIVLPEHQVSFERRGASGLSLGPAENETIYLQDLTTELRPQPGLVVSPRVQFFVAPDVPAPPGGDNYLGAEANNRPWPVNAAGVASDASWNDPAIYRPQGFLVISW